jgi:hypothetical protein
VGDDNGADVSIRSFAIVLDSDLSEMVSAMERFSSKARALGGYR